MTDQVIVVGESGMAVISKSVLYYLHGHGALCALNCTNLGESEVAETWRAALDTIWRDLKPEEIELIKKVLKDLGDV